MVSLQGEGQKCLLPCFAFFGAKMPFFTKIASFPVYGLSDFANFPAISYIDVYIDMQYSYMCIVYHPIKSNICINAYIHKPFYIVCRYRYDIILMHLRTHMLNT